MSKNGKTPKVGERFGKLTVIKLVKLPCCKYKRVICSCDCGNTVIRTTNTIHDSSRQICDWCKDSENSEKTSNNGVIPEVGERFGKLTVKRIERESMRKYIKVICVCDCGNRVSRTPRTIRQADRQMCEKCSGQKSIGKKLTNKPKTGQNKYDYYRPIDDPLREFTPDTEWLICLWHSEGDSCKEIAATLKRDEKVIEETIKRCIIDGSYHRYARRSMKYREIFKEKDYCKTNIQRGSTKSDNVIKSAVAKVYRGSI